ncbi:hypothetical protein [Fimbriimonas ginsengisoli]|uniref:Prophage PSPPH06, GNAT family acetyltransferase n=1 Tax=Fimbriimonas ginsengisoli Gsoil 348 TaxID=661478 RepID=A0A068NTC1_FIMGI|nr:hypothetical protein [Fimbriimonas ginsengisoli]AIE86562.1 prophage PSPPH06, GNAT family acetyltransferase [Fimbriimonas ginsengisoli Gsoil 348]
MIEIRPIWSLDSEAIQPLVEASLSEGYRFVQRLVDEWQTGINRFDKPGEALFGAYRNNRLVGVGGLLQCPIRWDASGGFMFCPLKGEVASDRSWSKP